MTPQSLVIGRPPGGPQDLQFKAKQTYLPTIYSLFNLLIFLHETHVGIIAKTNYHQIRALLPP
jgi:hypothetical protein